MATISPDGKTVLSVAEWKAELSVGYILKKLGEVEHRLCYLKREGGRTQHSLKEFIAFRDGKKARGRNAASGKVASVRHTPEKAFSDEVLAEARALVDGGMSIRQAATNLGVKSGTLASRLKRSGVACEKTPEINQTETESV